MNSYEHIVKMEKIKNDYWQMIKDLEKMLDRIEANQEDYQALIQYYYSEQRDQDLKDDEQDRIPKTLCRGVLSEDEIFDLMGDCYNAGIRMMEDALKMIKAK